MDFIKKHPFARLLIPLLTGILIQPYLNIPDTFLQVIPWVAVATICFAIFIKLHYQYEFIRGVIINFVVLFAGFYLAALQQGKTLLPNKNEVLVYAKLLNVPTEKTSTYKAQLFIKA